MKIWLAILLGSIISVAIIWFPALPLGIPGEWTWERTTSEPDLYWNLASGVVAAALFIAFVLQGRRRFENFADSMSHRFEVAVWLIVLVAFSFAWLWIVQEISPTRNRLGKAAFVLYYPSSSGYFTRARYDDPQAVEFLGKYEALMQEGDVLHTGTHPPGLFLVFHGLIGMCESIPGLSSFLDASQPASFRESCDIIASNAVRSRHPRPLLPLDRRVLWLATLLVLAAASLTVIPLFAVLRQGTSLPNAWICAALWPTLPAVAIFVPKSDVVFALIGMSLLWIWLVAWNRRSILLALLAGAVTWCGLMCSLAFIPVLMVAGLMTLGSLWWKPLSPAKGIAVSDQPDRSTTTMGFRHAFCVVAGLVGFAIPTYAFWTFAHVNLLRVWWWNYHNHAGFYRQYSRVYWKWLLINPIELMLAAGWPVALLAALACVAVLKRGIQDAAAFSRRPHMVVVGSVVFVWGLLWLTGKNSGEAARLWILFLPWLIWIFSGSLESILPDQIRTRRSTTSGVENARDPVRSVPADGRPGFWISDGLKQVDSLSSKPRRLHEFRCSMLAREHRVAREGGLDVDLLARDSQ